MKSHQIHFRIALAAITTFSALTTTPASAGPQNKAHPNFLNFAERSALAQKTAEELRSAGISEDQIQKYLTLENGAEEQKVSKEDQEALQEAPEVAPEEAPNDEIGKDRWIPVFNGRRVEIIIHGAFDPSRRETIGQYAEVYEIYNGSRNHLRSYWVSLGTPGHSTPAGVFDGARDLDRDHVASGVAWAGAPMNNYVQLGASFGLHETPYETRLGSPASHGCIRESAADSDWLFELAKSVGKDSVRTTITYKPIGGIMPETQAPYIQFQEWNKTHPSGTPFPTRVEAPKKNKVPWWKRIFGGDTV